ncbi:putative membrane protein YccC [Catenulispora sp. EB89]|uniref:FUSC family protein n=1 Tax=Catenulispora sp. EB89 TaxID=3156257 RepID=UPI003512AF90
MGISAAGDTTRASAPLELWDRIVASDPGLVRARMAVSGAVAMAAALAVEFGYAEAIHDAARGVLVAMLLGGMVAIMGSMALTGTARRPKVCTAVFFPVAFGAGLLPGALVAGHKDLMLCVFVVVMFAAVWVRRFGPAFFFYGFMLFMGYFFAAFLGAKLSTLPTFFADLLVGTGVSLLLSLTVLGQHPGRTLTRLRNAFGARARAVARACADLLEAGDDPRRTARAVRRLHSRGLRLAETALVIDAWLSEPNPAVDAGEAFALRRRLLDAQLALDELAHATEALIAQGGQRMQVPVQTAGLIARRDYHAARQSAQRLLPRHDDPMAVEVAAVHQAFELLDAVNSALPASGGGGDRGRGRGRVSIRARITGTASANAQDVAALESTVAAGTELGAQAPLARFALAATAIADLAIAGTPEQSEVPRKPAHARAPHFAPAVALVQGRLPGSAAVAGALPARGRWNPLSRASLTTRQAVQVALAGALAIVLGRILSPERYYWAVIAAFVVFGGTATRSETSHKALARVLGTALGLGVGVGLAALTSGHTVTAVVVIVASMSCGFYVVNLSYAGMIFFVTIMVAQLYGVLHETVPSLLVLRLKETALGAAVGIAVGVFVLPTSTRDTLDAAERAFLESVADVLRASASALDDETEPDLPVRVRLMEERMRQLALVAKPMTRPLISGTDPVAARDRLAGHASIARRTRALADVPNRLAGSGAAGVVGGAAGSGLGVGGGISDGLGAGPSSELARTYRVLAQAIEAR